MDLVVLKFRQESLTSSTEDDQGKSAEYNITYKAFCLLKNFNFINIMKKKLLFIAASCICFSFFAACSSDDVTINENQTSGTGAMILRTTNEGLTWSKTFVPGYDLITSIIVMTPQIEKISVLATEYGGRHNILRSNYYGENCISTLTPTYILGDLVSTHGYGKGIAVGSSSVVKTTDDGQNWVYDHNEDFEWLTADFCDEMHGIILSARNGDSTAVTTNGGVAWMHRAPVSEIGLFDDIILLDTATVFALGGNRRIYKSTDFSVSWEPVENPATSRLKCIGFFGDVGIIAGEGNVMLRSTDRGLTWTTLDPGFSSANEVFLDASAYWAVGTNYISKSTDQGLTWEIIYTKADEYFYDMYFSKNEGYAVGQRYVR